MNRLVLFIVNPISGNTSKEKVVKQIHLQAANFQQAIEVIYTQHKGHAFELAAAADENKYKTIVAVGGDGTVNEVASALINKAIPLGIVPLGSGNGLSRFLKIPLQPVQAIRNCFNGNLHPIDAIQINTHYSFNVSGIGFDAQVAHRFQHQKKRGVVGYVISILKELRSFKSINFNLSSSAPQSFELNNKETFILSVANSNQFGNNAIIAPNAKINDGLFDLVWVAPFSLLNLPWYAINMFAKRFNKLKKVSSFQFTTCIIHTAHKQWHIDGEAYFIDSPVEIKVLPLAITILVPQKKRV